MLPFAFFDFAARQNAAARDTARRALRGTCKGFTCAIALIICATHMRGETSPHTTPFAIQTVVGNPRNGDGGPAIAAQISGIQGIAADRFGNVYLSDTSNHRVRRVARDGGISTVAGT